MSAAGLHRPPWLAGRAAATPRAIALAVDGRELSWAALAERVRERAAAYAGAGVRPGDRVGVLIEDPEAFTVVLHAVHACGACAVVLHPRRPAPELSGQLERAGPGRLLHDPATAAAARAAAEAAGRQASAWDHPAGASPAPEAAAARCLDDDAVVLFTSGTTGRSRGARLRFGNFLASAEASARALPLAPGDRWLACMPLCHVGGLSILTRCVLSGATAVVQRGFDAAAVSRVLEEGDVHLVSLVPVMLRRLLDRRAGRPAPPGLRALLLGGAAAPAPWVAEARAAGFPIVPTYGLTEACSQVATESPERPGSGLRALPGTDLRIVDDARRPRPPGAPGRIEVRGATVSPGYLGEPDRSDAWLETGDYGRLGPDGVLVVLDRRDDLIVSGGENVYPAQVEAALLTHPAVAEAAVVGRADARYGQRPVAFVVPSGARPSAEALRRHLRERLAGFQVPDAFAFVPELPRSAAGKVLRRVLRERAGAE